MLATGREIDARAAWGSKFIDTLSHDIRAAVLGVKGFSARHLKYMAESAREASEELCNSCCTIPRDTITHLIQLGDTSKLKAEGGQEKGLLHREGSRKKGYWVVMSGGAADE